MRARFFAVLLMAPTIVRGQDVNPQQARPRLLNPMILDTMAVPAADLRERYGTDSLQFGELRVPRGRGPFPVAVVVHGGCWLSQIGTYRATLRYMAPLAEALRADGIATWNIAYRRVDEPGGGWPNTFTDVGSAVDHVRELAKRFPLDTTHVIIVGHSSGAHLALWAAGRRRLPQGSVVRTGDPLPLGGVVALGGPGDMLDFATYDQRICGQRVTSRVFGVYPDTSVGALRDRAREASPAELLPLGVPQRLIVGTRDGVLPPANATAYESRARSAGDDVRYIPVDGGGHFDALAPSGIGWIASRAAILELLGKGQTPRFPNNEDLRHTRSLEDPQLADEMYRALRQQGVPEQLVTYPRENHGPLSAGINGSPSPEPWHGLDARQRIVKFISEAFAKQP